eukprot:TRINITY_DN19491_c0_g3_i1.p1 TRINITY_DN19491_c0_g3~~TRINITY_DN19491_c0_g3_i1.p1  ORF type:complete len:257 (-),score=43.28 TRINITY_DN19491_c0_g3_i1:70-840(-)
MNDEIRTEYDRPDAVVSTFARLVDADSMALQNDPRYFQGSVLDKRLAAFAGLGVVSGLMTDAAMEQVMGSNKDFNWHSVSGWIQFGGFVLMTLVLWSNILSTYVAVVQLYHTTRLMTSGSTGFEMAAAYYLNKNIVFWRHVSIKGMLVSLPILLVSIALKLLIKFNKDQLSSVPHWITFTAVETGVEAGHPNFHGLTLSGLLTCIAYLLAGCWLWCIHQRHMAVFREKYVAISDGQPYFSTMTHTFVRSSARVPDV